jgi:hypothetical protein
MINEDINEIETQEKKLINQINKKEELIQKKDEDIIKLYKEKEEIIIQREQDIIKLKKEKEEISKKNDIYKFQFLKLLKSQFPDKFLRSILEFWSKDFFNETRENFQFEVSDYFILNNVQKKFWDDQNTINMLINFFEDKRKKDKSSASKYDRFIKFAELLKNQKKQTFQENEINLTQKVKLYLNSFDENDIQTIWEEGDIKIPNSNKANVRTALIGLYEKLSEEIHESIKEKMGEFLIPIDNSNWKPFDILAIISFLKKIGLPFKKASQEMTLI